MSDSQQNPQPNFAELVASLAALNRPAQVEPQGIAKHIGNGLAIIVLGMGFWMASTISSLQNTLTGVSTKVDAITKTLADVQTAQGGSTAAIGDIKAQNAGLSQRVTSIETSIQRMNERVRIVEGQKPLAESRDGP